MTSIFSAARLQYGEARARDLSFMAILALWRKRKAAGMTQADLAARLGRDTGWLSKKLKGPANWTNKTLGHMVEALDGELEIIVHDRLEPPRHADNFDAYEAAKGNDIEQHGIGRVEGPSNGELGALRHGQAAL